MIENPAACFRGVQATEEDIKNTPEVFVIFIPGDTAAQIEICRNSIEMILEKIGMLQHRDLDPFLIVIAELISEPVRFPIDDIVAVLEAKKQIDESSHETFHLAKLQASQTLGKLGRQRKSPLLHENF